MPVFLLNDRMARYQRLHITWSNITWYTCSWRHGHLDKSVIIHSVNIIIRSVLYIVCLIYHLNLAFHLPTDFLPASCHSKRQVLIYPPASNALPSCHFAFPPAAISCTSFHSPSQLPFHAPAVTVPPAVILPASCQRLARWGLTVSVKCQSSVTPPNSMLSELSQSEGVTKIIKTTTCLSVRP